MSMPLFDDVDPPPACGCEGCARQRLADSMARETCATTSTGATRMLVVAAAAGTALGGTAATVTAAPRPAAVTGYATGRGTLAAPGTATAATPLRLTRAQILQRARAWVAAAVPYSMTAHWKDGYRQDCSGFVSMAWGLGVSAWTGNLDDYAVRITRAQLRPGDMLLFHNTADPQKGSHAVIFAGWTDDARTRYTAYEQTAPRARVRTTPYAYWAHSAGYVPYRYRHLTSGAGGAKTGDATGYPGRAAFGPGRSGGAVTRLGTLLVGRGAGAHYRIGPGPVWSGSDRRATAAFQRAQGWTGADADGLPGPTTWAYLVRHQGHDVPGSAPRTGEAAAGVPVYPGAGAFRPGRSNDSVLALGRRLVAKGFGAGYRPSRNWHEADRRKVEAFQRAQGWSGRRADGYPGPEMWRRLFS
ncbi:peptidoglycan-binding protein [Streptomyces sp. NBC_01198]|uniref:peptidoglycan-binding protein n=1 Tax=Streptomyces sp. NBC_01198 TaxID=2903769 RepID=UPI002E0E99C9|nr:peptidoglycan-binding protein [Streptomyces sp. NBC_01198]